MIAFDVPLIPVLRLVLGVILPVLVGLVTTRAISAGRKAVLLTALSVITSLLTELIAALQAGAVYNLGLALVLDLGTFIVSVAPHYGLLKPTGVSTAARGSFRTVGTIHGEVVQEDYNGIPGVRPRRKLGQAPRLTYSTPPFSGWGACPHAVQSGGLPAVSGYQHADVSMRAVAFHAP